MIEHLVRLVWKRKRSAALNIVEVFLSFLAVFAIAAPALRCLDLYRQPLGFVYDRVWLIEMDRPSSEAWTGEEAGIAMRLLDEAESFDQVEHAALSVGAPFGGAHIYTTLEADGVQIKPQAWEVSDGFLDTMGLDLVEGRWFSAEDDAHDFLPVVINQHLRRERFRGGEAVGQVIGVVRGSGREFRVVGVISDFRHHGDLNPTGDQVFLRADIDKPFMPLTRMLVRVRPGTEVAFEEQLTRRLQAVARGWSFEVKHLDEMRATYLRNIVVPFLIGAILAAFLLVMVALGLLGVLWQSVTQRTRELGLRRAVGANRRRIYRQITAELLLVTTLGIAAALALLLQLGLFEVLAELGTRACVQGAVVSTLVIATVSALCALYPSWLATTVRPAEALHWE